MRSAVPCPLSIFIIISRACSMRLRRLKLLDDHGCDADPAGFGQALRQGLHGEALKLVMPGISAGIGIAAGNRGERFLRLFQPLPDQDALEVLACLSNFFRVSTLRVFG